jgi:hypothetical protein
MHLFASFLAEPSGHETVTVDAPEYVNAAVVPVASEELFAPGAM